MYFFLVDLVEIAFFKKLVKTVALDDGRPPGALVLTKLIEWHRFEVGQKKTFFVTFVTCRSRVICKKDASLSSTMGAQAKTEVAPPGPKRARSAFFCA